MRLKSIKYRPFRASLGITVFLFFLALSIAQTAGAEIVQITSSSGINTEPRFSNDGQKVAFSSNSDGDFDIYVVNADGTGLTNQLTNDPEIDSAPAWSPNDAEIAFASRREQAILTKIYEIFRMNADGSVETNVTQRAFVPPFGDPLSVSISPDWSPDGTKIMYSGKTAPSVLNSIFTINPDGSGRAELLELDATSLGQPRWSPDAGRIAFNTSGTGDIYTALSGGSGPTLFFGGTQSGARLPSWSDSDTLVFVSNFEGNYTIYRRNLDGSGFERFSETAGPDTIDAFPDVSPNGSKLVFSALDGGLNMQLYVADISDLGVETVEPSPPSTPNNPDTPADDCSLLKLNTELTTAGEINTGDLARKGVPATFSTSLGSTVTVKAEIKNAREARLLGLKQKLFSKTFRLDSGNKSKQLRLSKKAQKQLKKRLGRRGMPKSLKLKLTASFKYTEDSDIETTNTVSPRATSSKKIKKRNLSNRKEHAGYSTCSTPLELTAKAGKKQSLSTFTGKKGMAVTVGCNTGCNLDMALSVANRYRKLLRVKSGKKVASKKTTLEAGETRELKLKMSKSLRQRLRTIKKRRSASSIDFTLELNAKNSDGRQAEKNLPVRLVVR